MIVDECPAAEALSGGYNCDTCKTSEKNVMGQTYNFDIAIDAMSTSQVRRRFLPSPSNRERFYAWLYGPTS